MAQVENPPSDDSPENQSYSDSHHQPNTNGNNNKHSKVMENCIALFLKFGAAASPTKTLSPKLKALIEQRLRDSFPVHHRPDHLPYAAMIQTAISKLNEKGGSSEEAISHFIRKENHDLPWAHDMFVKHHLENLCKDGSICKTRYGLFTINTNRVSINADPSISSSPSDISSSFNSDSDVNVSKIQKGRLSHIKVDTKRGRLNRMNKEKESEEDSMDDGLTNTSSEKQGSDKDEEENMTLEDYKKVNRIKTKEKTIKKQFTEKLAIVALNGHEDTVYKELNGSGAQEEVVGQELAIVAQNGHEDTVYKELNGSGAREEVVGQKLAIVALNGQDRIYKELNGSEARGEVVGQELAIVAQKGHEDMVDKEVNGSEAHGEVVGQELVIVSQKGHEDMVDKEVNGSEAHGEVVGQDQGDKVMRIQMDRQESEAQVKPFDRLIEGKRGVTGLKDKPQLEETNQLQEHDEAPIRKQCCVKKKKKKYQLPKRNRKGQKARIMAAGRRRGKRSNDNETAQDELNEDQTLMEVLNAIKRRKKGKEMIEKRTEHAAHRSRLPEESRMHEAFGGGKGDVVVEVKDEKQKPRVLVIGLSRKHEAFGAGKRDVVVRKHEAFGAGKRDVVVRKKVEKQKQDVVVIGLFSSSCPLGTK